VGVVSSRLQGNQSGMRATVGMAPKVTRHRMVTVGFQPMRCADSFYVMWSACVNEKASPSKSSEMLLRHQPFASQCPDFQRASLSPLVTSSVVHCSICFRPSFYLFMMSTARTVKIIIQTTIDFLQFCMGRTRNTSVGIATGYGLDGLGSILCRSKRVFFIQSF
jgi:hypothetical protein